MDDWEFHLGEEPPKLLPKQQDELLVPIFADRDKWANYSDLFLYEAEKALRKWIALCSKNSKWRGQQKYRRYTFKMLYEEIFGKPYTQAETAPYMPRLVKLFSYYSSRIQKAGSINNKMYSKTIYCISPARLEKPPYSLRLRIEWFAERGEVPNNWNMKLPKDSLKAGHARLPLTEANMERRREEGRRRYNERYKDRNH